MSIKSIKLNIFFPIFIIIGIVMCLDGAVNWQVLVLIVLSQCEAIIKLR